MIRIEITYKDGKIIDLLVKGHSESAIKGKDLICAGVSSIVIGGANAIEKPECFTFKTEDGFFEISELTKACDHDYQTLKVMSIQLKTIEETYPNNVKIIEKGN